MGHIVCAKHNSHPEACDECFNAMYEFVTWVASFDHSDHPDTYPRAREFIQQAQAIVNNQLGTPNHISHTNRA